MEREKEVKAERKTRPWTRGGDRRGKGRKRRSGGRRGADEVGAALAAAQAPPRLLCVSSRSTQPPWAPAACTPTALQRHAGGLGHWLWRARAEPLRTQQAGGHHGSPEGRPAQEAGDLRLRMGALETISSSSSPTSCSGTFKKKSHPNLRLGIRPRNQYLQQALQ